MATITLNVNENVLEKFYWLLGHFSKNEIAIVNEIDVSKLSLNDFDYISNEKMDKLKNISNEYKNGNKDDFEEYIL